MIGFIFIEWKENEMSFVLSNETIKMTNEKG